VVQHFEPRGVIQQLGDGASWGLIPLELDDDYPSVAINPNKIQRPARRQRLSGDGHEVQSEYLRALTNCQLNSLLRIRRSYLDLYWPIRAVETPNPCFDAFAANPLNLSNAAAGERRNGRFT
jgi:hypothetical protein